MKRKILVGLLSLAFISLAAGIAFAQDSSGTMPSPPFNHFNPRMGLSGLCADLQHIYVMAGGKIMEYDLAGLTIQKTIDLPELLPPSGAPPKAPESGQFPPPPHMGGPHGLWADENFLYVLAGPVMYRYSTPDLVLHNTVELPKPELPQNN